MYKFETFRKDFFWILLVAIVGAIAIMIVMQLANEIALPGELREKPGEIVGGFLLITVMIGFIAGAFRSVPFIVSKLWRRTLIALGLVGFAVPMIDIGDEGGVTLVDIYEVILPGFLLAAFLITIPQLLYASVRGLRSLLARARVAR